MNPDPIGQVPRLPAGRRRRYMACRRKAEDRGWELGSWGCEVLGYSRLIWARFVIHQDLQSVLRCHFAALETVGGAPRENLYDRMTIAVIAKVRTVDSSTWPARAAVPIYPRVRLIARDRPSDPRRLGPFQVTPAVWLCLAKTEWIFKHCN